MGALTVHQAVLAQLLPAHKQVLRDVQVVKDIQLLINNGDARALGGQGACDRQGLPLKIDLPLVHGIHPGEDFHQRGFSRAVLPHQGQDLAGIHREIHLIQGLHPRKGLADAAHLQKRGGRGPLLFSLLHLFPLLYV